ncbi:MAG: hypothetical protein UY35_C0005G0079 [Candidatus Saccharibacteria bacterium GW2011_GWC2_48_9]|nr:MAG: hypothetical protein UY35_C0005G0079 [Candidatus Saccharibacteria bacterium GW2011_GWC2_48_9]HCH34242.1 hypothetical protein [Candidatus Saccharibacteria bacterium]
MAKQDDLLQRIEAIERRNEAVTLDKKWETSWVRRVSIIMFTYIVVLAYLFVIGNENPWINAIVPPVGFFLSTLALGWLRKNWQEQY